MVTAFFLKLGLPVVLCFLAKTKQYPRRPFPTLLAHWLASAVIFWLVLMPYGLMPPALSTGAVGSTLLYLPLRFLKWGVTLRYIAGSWSVRGRREFFWGVIAVGIVGDFAADYLIPGIRSELLDAIGAQK